MRFARVAWMATVLGAVVGPSCDSTTSDYKATATFVSNTCGNGPWAGAPPNPWTFTVGISDSNGSLTWTPSDGTPPLSGPVVAAAVSLTGSVPVVDAPLDGGGGGTCTLNMAESFSLTLLGVDAGGPPSSFTGTLGYTFTPGSAAACSYALVSGGGQYAALPCSFQYTVVGAK